MDDDDRRDLFRSKSGEPVAINTTTANSVYFAAAAVIASAEVTAMGERLNAADIAAAISRIRTPGDLARIRERQRHAWLAGQHAANLAIEHNRVARRSVVAATLAAEVLASGLTAEEFASSELMNERIGAIVSAVSVVRRSDAALDQRSRAWEEKTVAAPAGPRHGRRQDATAWPLPPIQAV